jgi:hypothetical protein
MKSKSSAVAMNGLRRPSTPTCPPTASQKTWSQQIPSKLWTAEEIAAGLDVEQRINDDLHLLLNLHWLYPTLRIKIFHGSADVYFLNRNAVRDCWCPLEQFLSNPDYWTRKAIEWLPKSDHPACSEGFEGDSPPGLQEMSYRLE